MPRNGGKTVWLGAFVVGLTVLNVRVFASFSFRRAFGFSVCSPAMLLLLGNERDANEAKTKLIRIGKMRVAAYIAGVEHDIRVCHVFTIFYTQIPHPRLLRYFVKRSYISHCARWSGTETANMMSTQIAARERCNTCTTHSFSSNENPENGTKDVCDCCWSSVRLKWHTFIILSLFLVRFSTQTRQKHHHRRNNP